MPPGAPQGCSNGLRLFRGSSLLQNLCVRWLPEAVLVREEAGRLVLRVEGARHGAWECRGQASGWNGALSMRAYPHMRVTVGHAVCLLCHFQKLSQIPDTDICPASESCGETQTKRSLAVGLEACSRAAGCLEGSTPAVWDHSVGPLWAGCLKGTELEEGAIPAGPGGTSLGRKPRERCGSSLAVPKGGHHSSRQADDSWRETQPLWSRTSENPLQFRD